MYSRHELMKSEQGEQRQQRGWRFETAQRRSAARHRRRSLSDINGVLFFKVALLTRISAAHHTPTVSSSGFNHLSKRVLPVSES